MNDKQTQEKSTAKRIGMAVFIVFAVLFALFFFYTENYYHADRTAVMMLRTDEYAAVTSSQTGLLFDGPGAEDLLIFYPGAKVQETAYAPLLRQIAESGMDVFLVRMPFHLAFFGTNKADEALQETADYANVYVGGHSLGGAMAANYAAEHAESLDGVILLAAYSTKPLPGSLPVLSVYGTEDGVLNRANYEKNLANVPNLQEVVIEGGNHAQFGSYGEQRGDGEASIDPGRQWNETAEAILEFAGIGE
ncbi:MAG: alpha/beta fold hydrolase [Firmicutes bacterium]|nr:alpha/beta fold hydrolase [Bacillota bacterium]